jgi:S-adenosylmethionine:tRNA ribosyltransferase-isomerase
MLVRDFDFDLPPELIAQEPVHQREAARLFHLDPLTGETSHRRVSDLPRLLRPGDLLVVNNTRVFPARLIGRRLPGGGAVECLLIARAGAEAPDTAQGELWEGLVHPGQRLGPGRRLIFEGPTILHGEILERRFHGRRLVRLWTDDGSPVDAAVDAIGHMPLPPYIRRADRSEDRDRYQTVFARERGSVAAPTAGLHLTVELIEEVRARGIEVAEVTLHVGYGTFEPVRVADVESHRVDAERYHIGEDGAAMLNRALDEQRRIVAVGTTTTRTLEGVAALHDGRFVPGRGSTDLFIYPGFRFRAVSGLLTNFHLPQSSLLMLVCAFGGTERILACYREAVAERYRFYSYGDAMLIL